MNKKSDKNLIVGLDIGTSKVVAIVGEVSEDGNIEIVGIGSHPSESVCPGSQHDSGHDQPQPGTNGGKSGRHRLCGTLLANSRNQHCGAVRDRSRGGSGE